MKYNPLFLLVFAICLTACKGNQGVVNKKPIDKTTEKIVFHSFKAERKGELIIEEVEKVFRDGSIKELNNKAEIFNHPLEVVFLDNADKRIKSLFVEHPLINEYEYADNDGQLKRISSYEDSATFTIRYNNIENLRSIYFLSNNSDTIPINLKLKLK